MSKKSFLYTTRRRTKIPEYYIIIWKWIPIVIIIISLLVMLCKNHTFQYTLHIRRCTCYNYCLHHKKIPYIHTSILHHILLWISIIALIPDWTRDISIHWIPFKLISYNSGSLNVGWMVDLIQLRYLTPNE